MSPPSENDALDSARTRKAVAEIQIAEIEHKIARMGLALDWCAPGDVITIRGRDDVHERTMLANPCEHILTGSAAAYGLSVKTCGMSLMGDSGI